MIHFNTLMNAYLICLVAKKLHWKVIWIDVDWKHRCAKIKRLSHNIGPNSFVELTLVCFKHTYSFLVYMRINGSINVCMLVFMVELVDKVIFVNNKHFFRRFYLRQRHKTEFVFWFVFTWMFHRKLFVSMA